MSDNALYNGSYDISMETTKYSNRCVVVIPLYKEFLSTYEQISLMQCNKVLKQYKKVFICPQGLNYSSYEDLLNGEVKYYSQEFFRSVESYNDLMLQRFLYEDFLPYDYMLIYQLDGFVFFDGIAKFLDMDLDYVGAPWLDGMRVYRYNFKGVCMLSRLLPNIFKYIDVFVGNGGVSLRRIESFCRLFDLYEGQINKWRYNEDVLYGYLGTMRPNTFRLADIATALQFAFETNPQECYEKNNFQLPCFCHAWEKYDIGFWRKIFQKYGYSI